MNHGTIETHVQKILASIHRKENNKEVLLGNRLTKTRRITMGGIWNTDCKPCIMMESIINVAVSDLVLLLPPTAC